MILIALGANQNGPWGSPQETMRRALAELDRGPLHLVRASPLIITKPYGVKNQPDFVNAVAIVETALPPYALLRLLHAIEKRAGRQRGRRWGPRRLDLDILDYHGQVRKRGAPLLPHPGLAQRRFVLEPIAAIAPRWRHPVIRVTSAGLLKKLR